MAADRYISDLIDNQELGRELGQRGPHGDVLFPLGSRFLFEELI